MLVDNTSTLNIKVSESTGVVHWRSESAGPLLPQALAQISPVVANGLSEGTFRELFELGAIYTETSRLCDWGYLTAEQKSGTYLRLHTQPRRYSLAQIDWRSRILSENDDFVIFDKPAGVPCHPMVDNQLENLATGLSDFLKSEIHVTHRLDVGTRGLLLFAKTKNFQKQFNSLLSLRQVCKKYRVFTEAPTNFFQGQILTHYMHPSPYAPKRLEVAAFPGAQECLLRILMVSQTRTEVELLTGRTHQIRAQFAASGFPLVGDSTYGNSQDTRPLGLEAYYLEFPYQNQSIHFTIA